MFDKQEGIAVGAREKQRRAQALKSGKSGDLIHSGKGGGGVNRGPAVTVLCILAMSVALAYFLTDGPWARGVPVETGMGFIDRNILSGMRPNFIGDSMIDHGILVLLRGILIMCFAGILPLAALTWTRLLDRPDMSPWRTVWGVGIGMCLAYYIITAAAWPLLKGFFGIV